MTKNILHISGAETKFILPFRNWLLKNFDQNHIFFVSNIPYSQRKMFNLEGIKTITPYDSSNSFVKSFFLIFKFIKYIIVTSKLIISHDQVYVHGLFDKKLIILLYLKPSLNKKVNWILWGGGDLDLIKSFSSRILNQIECIVKSRFKSFITYIDEDYIDVITHYNTSGPLKNCLLYNSNVYNNNESVNISNDEKNTKEHFNVLVGHSADHEGDHINMLNMLYKKKLTKNSSIYCILSYGEKPWTPGYKDLVIKTGKELFGDYFHPINNFMSKKNYLEFLNKIDIMIFNHRYQQGMGNIIQALGMNKIVFLNSEANHYKMFKRLNINVFSINEFELFLTNPKFNPSNNEMISSIFSESKLLEGWKNIFNKDD